MHKENQMAYNISVDDEALDIRTVKVSSNLSLTDSHSYLYVDSNGGPVTITLPQGHGGSTSTGKVYIIKRKGGNNVNITHHANDRVLVGSSINNYSGSPYILADGVSLWIIYAGAHGNPVEGEWHIIAEFDGSIG